MTQDGVVLMLVAAAAVYVVRSWLPSKCGSACGKCVAEVAVSGRKSLPMS